MQRRFQIVYCFGQAYSHGLSYISYMELIHRWCCAILDAVILFVERLDMVPHLLSAAEDIEDNTTMAEDIEDNTTMAEDIEDNTTMAEVTSK
jgi:hypothetical protein